MKMRVVLLLSAAVVWACLPTAVADWSDNFDAYANGTQLHGVGGWKGWDNDPNAGAKVTNVQSLSAPHSVDIVGASDLIHPYTGYTSGTWVYTAWQFVPTNFTGKSYFLLLNRYNDGGPYNWSVQAYADSATNKFKADMPAGPVAETALIKGQWVEIRTVIDLTNDKNDLYYNNVLLYTGKSWKKGVFGNDVNGVADIATVDLFANNATSVYYDDMSLVPEPASLLLLALGALAVRRR